MVVHVCISGFLQSEASWNGVLRLYVAHIEKLCAHGETLVDYRPWNSNWRHLAAYIRNRALPGKTVRIGIYAYSWGAGWGAMRLAQELQGHGLIVDRMVLADPVYRHPLLVMRWSSWFGTAAIEVPGNVHDVRYFLQQRNKPSGHRLYRSSSRTMIHEPVMVDAPHQELDDWPAFHGLAAKTARELSGLAL